MFQRFPFRKEVQSDLLMRPRVLSGHLL